MKKTKASFAIILALALMFTGLPIEAIEQLDDTKVVQIMAGSSHPFASMSNGDLYTWVLGGEL